MAGDMSGDFRGMDRDEAYQLALILNEAGAGLNDLANALARGFTGVFWQGADAQAFAANLVAFDRQLRKGALAMELRSADLRQAIGRQDEASR